MGSTEEEPKARLSLSVLGNDIVNLPIYTTPYTIGRSQTCNYYIPNKIISGQHCRLSHDEDNGSFYLEDTSTNGMLINKKTRTIKGKKFPLRNGDEVFLVYRKSKSEPTDVISFRFEEVTNIQNVADMDQTQEEEGESTQEYVVPDESRPLDMERKRKRDNETVSSLHESKKLHLSPDGDNNSSVIPPTSILRDTDKIDDTAKRETRHDSHPTHVQGTTVEAPSCPEEPTTSRNEHDPKGAEGGQPTEKEVLDDSQDEMMQTLTCSICQDILLDCISLQPCMHTFCAACYSQWMAKSDKCPTCRNGVQRISKNHIVNNLVEAYLNKNPEKRRDPEEIEEMKKQNKITPEMMNIKPQFGDSSFSDDPGWDSSSEMDISESCEYATSFQPGFPASEYNWFGNVINPPSLPVMTCRQCPGQTSTSCAAASSSYSCTALPSTSATNSSSQNFRIAVGNFRVPLPQAPQFVCAPGMMHLMCKCCQERFPDRRHDQSTIPPISCNMCQMFYCHMYWGCTRNPVCFGCLNKFKDLKFGDKCMDKLILGNAQESSIFKKYLQQKNLTWESVLEECLNKLETGEFHSLFATINNITKDSVICYSCGLKVFKELAYQYRAHLPQDQLPAEVTSRPNCYWGKNCRTQFNKPDHAARFNHVCGQTRF